MAVLISMVSRTVTNVTWESSELFSVGHSTFFRVATCASYYRCELHFYIRDRFADPLDIGIESGGTPYNIIYDFYRYIWRNNIG